jgi:lipopolysaccharide transport system ATP-binding protein
LAVGDASFQKKCLDKMKETSKEGRTVLFVSHQMSSIIALCSRAIQIHQGSLLRDGKPETVVRQYLTEVSDQLTPERLWKDHESRPGNEQFRLAAMRVLDKRGKPQKVFCSCEPIVVEMEFELFAEPPALFIGFDLVDQNGVLLFRSCHNHGPDPEWPKLRIGWNRLQTTLPSRLLNHNTYYVAPRVGLNFIQWIVFQDAAVNFDVRMDHCQSSFWNGAHVISYPGAIAPCLDWKEVSSAETKNASSPPPLASVP